MLRLILLCRREHGSQRGGGSVRLQRCVFIDAREERPSLNLDLNLDLLHQARRVDRGGVVSRLCNQQRACALALASPLRAAAAGAGDAGDAEAQAPRARLADGDAARHL
eukprot:scaffold5330_cov59-Phaeocystis_antarctica.AAC.2